MAITVSGPILDDFGMVDVSKGCGPTADQKIDLIQKLINKPWICDSMFRREVERIIKGDTQDV
jgi:hypothetical protein